MKMVVEVSGSSKGRKAINMEMEKQFLVNKCLLGHGETVGYREEFKNEKQTDFAAFLPVYHT